MGLFLFIIASIVALVLLIAFAARLAVALRWLFWVILRLGLTGAIVIAIVLAGEVIGADGGAAALAALLGVVVTLAATHHWGRPVASLKLPRLEPAPASPPPPPGPEPVLSASQQASLDATEHALAHAARDDHSAAAEEWLTLWRRRVPDLIAAARNHHDDLDDAGKAAAAAHLAARLIEMIAEAERRIAIAKQSRADLFTIRANHVEGRVRNG